MYVTMVPTISTEQESIYSSIFNFVGTIPNPLVVLTSPKHLEWDSPTGLNLSLECARLCK